MKRATIAMLLALMLCLSLAIPAQAAQRSYNYEDYTNLLGSMEVVNVKSYTWLKDDTGVFARKLCKVPAGAVVTNCYYYDSQHTYCEYDGMAGYVSGEITNAKGETVSTEVGTVSVTLDDTSAWTLTADTYITEFNGNAANVYANGYTLYVNGVALEGVSA